MRHALYFHTQQHQYAAERERDREGERVKQGRGECVVVLLCGGVFVVIEWERERK